MNVKEAAGRAAGFIERNILKLTLLWFLLFAAYRIARFSGLFGLADLLGPVGAFSPGLADVAIFLASCVAFIALFKASMRYPGNLRVLALFLASFIMLAGFTQLSQPGWNDAQGYYDIAVLGAEEGPLYLLSNYHTLNTQWPEEFKSAMEDELAGLGLSGWGEDVLRLEVGEPNSFSGRIVKHPPLWPFVMSLFMLVLGTSELSALIAVWTVSALVPVAAYYLLKRFVKERDALAFAFVSALIPTFLLSGNAPLLDNMAALLVVSAVVLYIRGIDSGDWRMFVLSGAMLSLAFYTKFSAIFVLAPLMLLSILRKRLGFITHGFLMLIPFVAISMAFFSQNYFFFLTLATARANVAYAMPSYNTGLVSVLALPVYYLNYFGMPLVLMAAAYLLRNTTRKPGFPAAFSWLVAAAFVSILAFYPIKVGIERHILPFVFLMIVPVSIHASRLGERKRKRFVLMIFLVMVATAVLLMP